MTLRTAQRFTPKQEILGNVKFKEGDTKCFKDLNSFPSLPALWHHSSSLFNKTRWLILVVNSAHLGIGSLDWGRGCIRLAWGHFLYCQNLAEIVAFLQNTGSHNGRLSITYQETDPSSSQPTLESAYNCGDFPPNWFTHCFPRAATFLIEKYQMFLLGPWIEAIPTGQDAVEGSLCW